MKKLQKKFQFFVYTILLLGTFLQAQGNTINGTLTGFAPNITTKHIGSGIGSSMFGIAIHPTDTNNVFFSGDMGLVYHTTNAGATWSIVPDMYRIRFIEFDSLNPSIIWAGGESGLYKSVDGGNSWNRSVVIASAVTLGTIAIDPNNSNILYVAEGFPSRIKVSWIKGRVWKSFDGGSTWTELSRPGGELGVDTNYNRHYSNIVIDPNSSYSISKGHSRVYLMGRDGMFKTEDAGATWQDITFFTPRQGSSMVLVNKNNTSILFASVIPVSGQAKGGIYKSINNGATWVASNNGLSSIISKLKVRNRALSNAYMFSLMLVHSASNPNKLYIGSWQGLARSNDMGNSWTQTTPAESAYTRHASGNYVPITSLSRPNNKDTFAGGLSNFTDFKVSKSNANFLIFSDNDDIHFSIDGGSTWKTRTFDFRSSFVATDTVLPSLPVGSPKNRFTHRIESRGVQGLVNTSVAVDPFNSSIYYATYMDMGVQISRDGGKSWEHPTDGLPPRGHAWFVVVDPLVEGRLWISVKEQGAIYQSDDNGVTWTDASISDSSVGSVLHMALDAKSPSSNRTLYAATSKKGIYKSIDGGETWTALLAKPALDIQLDPMNSNVLYAGTTDGLYKSLDKGVHWSKLLASKVGKVYDISIGTDNKIYVVANMAGESGYFNLRKLWQLVDGGVTFTEITPSFMKNIGAVAVNPHNSNYLYISNFNKLDFGSSSEKMIMASSSDGGKTWKQIGRDFAFALGTNIYIDPKNRQHIFFITAFSLIEVYDRSAPTTGGISTPTPVPVPVDNVKPVITLKGSSTITVQEGTTYIDLGVLASDNVDGDITSKVTTFNPVDTNVPKTYIVTYDVTDKVGNSAIRVERTVIVEKTLLSTPPTTSRVYEDGEDKDTVGWSVYANSSSGATITNVFDSVKNSNVIKLQGSGTENGYMIGGLRSGRWNNITEKTLEWSMNYAEDFTIYIAVQTTKGNRYLIYTNIDKDKGLIRGGKIHHGLGVDSADGTWKTFTRDLEADLKEFDSDNSIVAVNAFMIRGSGKLDDIRTILITPKSKIVYEDGEDQDTVGWSVYANSSSGATITNVFDSVKNSHVIKLQGNGIENGYMIGGLRSGRWNNTSEKTLEWSMNYAEDFTIYIAVQTTKGNRYLIYTNNDMNKGLIRGGKIHHGLGVDSIDGTWRTFTRDLEVDLKEFDSDNSIVAVNAFMIRGSGKLDDIGMK